MDEHVAVKQYPPIYTLFDKDLEKQFSRLHNGDTLTEIYQNTQPRTVLEVKASETEVEEINTTPEKAKSTLVSVVPNLKKLEKVEKKEYKPVETSIIESLAENKKGIAIAQARQVAALNYE